jgi:hypothetical protein
MTNLFKVALAALSFVTFSSTASIAANCGMDFQHAYETGVSDGRADGSHQIKADAARHGRKVSANKDARGECYREGYKIGFNNAAADASKSKGAVNHGNAPTPGSNERAYYDDGCHEGTVDAQNSMSMAYVRHSDMYDRRFEPYFQQGYEACWTHFR